MIVMRGIERWVETLRERDVKVTDKDLRRKYNIHNVAAMLETSLGFGPLTWKVLLERVCARWVAVLVRASWSRVVAVMWCGVEVAPRVRSERASQSRTEQKKKDHVES